MASCGVLVALAAQAFELPEVVDPAQALQPGLLVEQGVDVGDGHAEFVVQEGVQPGVDVAGSGAHHQALQRGQTHRGVDGPAAADRRRRAAVAQVQHDLVQLAQVAARGVSAAVRDT